MQVLYLIGVILLVLYLFIFGAHVISVRGPRLIFRSSFDVVLVVIGFLLLLAAAVPAFYTPPLAGFWIALGTVLCWLAGWSFMGWFFLRLPRLTSH